MAGEWWRGAVIYQVYPRSFADGTGDGVGDLAGLAEKLPYVASLGVDAIWLSPVFVSPMRDFGYDVADWCAVDPLFGTMADFDRVVAGAHELGLKVILDQVWGHSSDRHPWFAESRASRANPKTDWYVWADPRPDGSPPNNWLSVFGGPAWTWEPRRRQYYLHHFLPSQPALDWCNPQVAEAMLAVGEFWLGRGVDGFRLDAVDFLAHDPGLHDNPPRGLAEIPQRPFAMQEHRHDMIQPSALAILGRIRTLTDRFPGTVTMAELSSVGDPFARAALYTAPGHLHTAYTLGVMRRPFTAASLTAIIAEVEAKVPAGTLAWAFSNHDVERAASRWGDGSPAAAQMMLALLLGLRGPVCLYQGEELGLPEADIPFERLVDPFGRNFWPDFKGRDGCRTPLPWTLAPEPVRPWLPVPDAHRALAVEVQEADGASTLNVTRRLLRWRRRHPALVDGALRLVDLDPALVAFEREGGGERLLCVFNPGPAERRVASDTLPAEGLGYRVEDGFLVLAGWGAAFLPVTA
ncbi:MAG: alpha-glucosidase [Actinomycetota bacterium]